MMKKCFLTLVLLLTVIVVHAQEKKFSPEKFNEALRDSIQHYLAVYNKDKKYSLILTKQGDNILYADKNYDITAEVVAGLNKAYKPKPLDK
jgi:outer membrane protein